jgi:hypothetical protein
MATVDAIELETKVKDLYRYVAEQPHGAYHFEMGRALAERLGYPAQPTRGRATWRRGTATSWRSMRSSASLAAELLASSTSHRSTWQHSR